MPSKSARAEREYAARLNLVLDYINTHLADDLKLDILARVARFSPYHFHRIFKALLGENLNDYVNRQRLEKAAQMLKHSPLRPITGIALDCGFSSSSNFARAFRPHFGCTAREYRKKCQLPRKNREAIPPGTWYHGTLTEDERSPMQVEVRTLPEYQVAYVRVLGYNDQLIGPAFDRICRWVAARGLFSPQSKVIGICYDDPAITPADKCRYDCAITVPPGTEAEGEIGRTSLPAGRYAVARYEGPITGIGTAWDELMRWLPASSLQPDDRPCFEIYLNDGKKHPARHYTVDLCLPVRPL